MSEEYPTPHEQPPRINDEQNLAICLDIMRCIAMYPQSLRGSRLVAQHALRGIDPEYPNVNGMDIRALGQVRPDAQELMPTLNRIHQQFGITIDGTKDGTPVYTTHHRLEDLVYTCAQDALDKLRYTTQTFSLNHNGPWVSMHTRPGKLQDFLVENPMIRQDVATEIGRSAAELREQSRARQEYVVADHVAKLASFAQPAT